MSPSALRPDWALLIYTVPATPSRKRAAVWREVKRLGAIYLRDGVCVLPDTASARAGLETLSQRVVELGGQSAVVWQAQLAASRADALLAEFAQAREAEYADIVAAATDLLRHLEHEAQHHGLDRAERVSLLADLNRLDRWLDADRRAGLSGPGRCGQRRRHAGRVPGGASAAPAARRHC